jgi:hypothetical protein
MRSTRRFVASIGTFLALALACSLLFVAPAGAQDPSARIHLIHGIPDVDVDVEAGGETVFEGFSFGDTQDLSALAGATLEDLQVKAAGTDDVAIDAGDVTLPESGNYTVIAHLDGAGTPTISVFDNDVSMLEAGEGRLTVRHTAAAPAVDVLAGGDAVLTDVVNGDGGTLDLPAGTVSASVVPTGETEPVVIGPADLDVAEGAHLLVYAVGSLDDESLTVLTETIEGLHGNPDRIDTGNSLPSVSDSGLSLAAALIGGLVLFGGAGSYALIRTRARA